MTPFDLVFVLCVIASVVTLVVLGVQALRRRPTARIRRALLAGWMTYAVLLLAVSLLAPQRYADLGTAQCSDEWCLTLVGASRVKSTTGPEYELRLDVANRGRGRAQRERFVTVYLVDISGQRIFWHKTTLIRLAPGIVSEQPEQQKTRAPSQRIGVSEM